MCRKEIEVHEFHVALYCDFVINCFKSVMFEILVTIIMFLVALLLPTLKTVRKEFVTVYIGFA